MIKMWQVYMIVGGLSTAAGSLVSQGNYTTAIGLLISAIGLGTVFYKI